MRTCSSRLVTLVLVAVLSGCLDTTGGGVGDAGFADGGMEMDAASPLVKKRVKRLTEGTDPNDLASEPESLGDLDASEALELSGSIDETSDPDDYFEVTATEAGELRIDLEGPDGTDFDLLVTVNGKEIEGGLDPDSNETLLVDVVPGDVVVINVWAADGGGGYTLMLDLAEGGAGVAHDAGGGEVDASTDGGGGGGTTGSVIYQSEELTYFATEDRTAGVRRRLSGDGAQLAFVQEEAGFDTSISGLVSPQALAADAAAAVMVYDMASGTAKKVHEGGLALRSDDVVSSFDHLFDLDIDDDGSTVAITFVRTVQSFDAGGASIGLVSTRHIGTVEVASGSYTEITAHDVGASPARAPVRISGDGQRAVYVVSSRGTATSVWGVAYDNDGPETLWTVPLNASAAPVQLSRGVGEGDDDFAPALTAFDISDDGSRIIFQHYGDGSIYTSDAAGNTTLLTTSSEVQQTHVAISGDGSTIAYADWGSSSFDGPESAEGSRLLVGPFGGGSAFAALDGTQFHPGTIYLSNDGSALIFSTYHAREFGYAYGSQSLCFVRSDGNDVNCDQSGTALGVSDDLSILITATDSPVTLQWTQQ